MTDHACRPAPRRAVCDVAGCGYADDVDATRATRGRTALWRDVQLPYVPDQFDREAAAEGCQCPRCRARWRAALTPRPGLTPDETDGVLDHVDDRTAVLYLLGYVSFAGCVECGWCGRWRPLFDDARSWPGLLVADCCPYHGEVEHLRRKARDRGL